MTNSGFFYIEKNVVNPDMKTLFVAGQLTFISNIEYSQRYNEKYNVSTFTAKISTIDDKDIIIHQYSEKALQKAINELFITVPEMVKNNQKSINPFNL